MISFAFDYTPMANTLSKIMMKHWHIVSDKLGCKEKPKISYRNMNNLKKNLVSVDMGRRRIEAAPLKGFFRCRNYDVCTQVWEINKITFPELKQMKKAA